MNNFDNAKSPKLPRKPQIPAVFRFPKNTEGKVREKKKKYGMMVQNYASH